jgi:NAD(P)H-hydrate epimerase
MATGGSGDVLTGVIAALIGQGLTAFDAAVLGAWAHGRAGDIAASKIGQVGLTAADLADHLPSAFREIESSW